MYLFQNSFFSNTIICDQELASARLTIWYRMMNKGYLKWGEKRKEALRYMRPGIKDSNAHQVLFGRNLNYFSFICIILHAFLPEEIFLNWNSLIKKVQTYNMFLCFSFFFFLVFLLCIEKGIITSLND